MKQIFDDRASGKTSRLILLAKEAGGIVVCRHPAAMKEKAIGYGITGVDFVSYQDYLDFIVSNEKPVFIDELSCFWKYFDPNFIGYSETKEEQR